MNKDVCFDDFFDDYKKKIRIGVKGRLRRDFLEMDLSAVIPTYGSGNLTILDAGGGAGERSIAAAKKGHLVTLADISEKMLGEAKHDAAASGVFDKITFCRCPLQDFSMPNGPEWDIIFLHGVLAWLAEPVHALRSIAAKVKSGGFISILYYNRDALIFKTAVSGGLAVFQKSKFRGNGKNLTPINPLTMDHINDAIDPAKFQVVHKRGIRIFADYFLSKENISRVDSGINTNAVPDSSETYQEIFDIEKEYSLREPFASLGRHVHIIFKKIVQKNSIKESWA